MIQEIMCDTCCHLQNVEVGYYAEQEEEQEVAVYVCDECKTKNSVFWRISLDYYAYEVTSSEKGKERNDG